MPLPTKPDSLEHPHDAAHWFARMQSGEVTEQDRKAFEAWRSADPEHDRQYRNLDYIWQVTLKLPEQRLRSMMMTPDTAGKPPHHDTSRRRFGLGLAGACAMAVIGGVAIMAGGSQQQPDTLTLSTQKGERRQARLPDGSMMFLNTDTVAVMRFYENQRQIELQHGEAFFEVSTDVTRPFIVDAGLGRVTVTGTRFNVRRDAHAMHVSVASGSVRVQTGQWWKPQKHHLTAGQQTHIGSDQRPGSVRHTNVDDVVAWMRGKVVFNNAPLAYVIDEMNRYLDMPARLEAPQLAQLHVSGIFSVDDPHAMINALPAIAPVRLERTPDGRLSIQSR